MRYKYTQKDFPSNAGFDVKSNHFPKLDSDYVVLAEGMPLIGMVYDNQSYTNKPTPIGDFNLSYVKSGVTYSFWGSFDYNGNRPVNDVVIPFEILEKYLGEPLINMMTAQVGLSFTQAMYSIGTGNFTIKGNTFLPSACSFGFAFVLVLLEDD